MLPRYFRGMRLTGVTSIPSPVTGLRAGNPPAEGTRRWGCGSRTVRQPNVFATCARSDVRKRTHRAISPFHPMHRNIVAKPTTVTQPTCVNTRAIRTGGSQIPCYMVPSRENYRNLKSHISILFYYILLLQLTLT